MVGNQFAGELGFEMMAGVRLEPSRRRRAGDLRGVMFVVSASGQLGNECLKLPDDLAVRDNLVDSMSRERSLDKINKLSAGHRIKFVEHSRHLLAERLETAQDVAVAGDEEATALLDVAQRSSPLVWLDLRDAITWG